ncbi:Ankyrin repeat-containing domain [Penicillium camemberti]|uniref:Ankyrin repeat-containing domain n=1 Tax=Penicillium camemberti (strain FM 013) TaxID=1429867 RepID=A0A0G4P4U0_PENC3|nr:Ankyrin repeat-containing domain [Penicillium camemberti]
MSILKLPPELLMSIAEALECRDLNMLLQCHSYLYKTLNDSLYQLNVQHHDASALYWAASSGSDKTLQRLLDAGANVQWESPYFACSVQKPGTRLRRCIWKENMKEHPISYAAAQGYLNIVEHLLDLGVDINYRDADGLTPLALAAREGHFPLTRALINQGAKQLSHDTMGQYPLAQAASKGYHDIEDYLFEKLRQYPYGKTSPGLDLYWMLKYAAERGDDDRIRYLLSQGADVNFQLPIESHSPLCGALAYAPSPFSTVKLLLEVGADPNRKASRSIDYQPGRPAREQAPLKLAVPRDESIGLIKLLIQYGADASKQSLALLTAIQHQKAAEFRLLIDNGARLDADYRRVSVAWRGINCGYQPIIDICLEHRVSPDDRRLIRAGRN